MNLRLLPLYALLLYTQFSFGQTGQELIAGERITLHSDVLNEDRKILVSLPENYSDPSQEEKNYPILILLDGATHFYMASGVIQFMSSERNRNKLIPETILVAIENVDRERDFTVTKLETKRSNRMGGGRNFLSFIETELIPYLDDNYRTTPSRTLVGHSLAGLLTVNAYLDAESLFDAYISIDPSIWWDEETMKQKVNSISPSSKKKKLYIATANQGEANFERNQKRHTDFVDMMRAYSGENVQVKITYFDEEDHRSVPLPAFYEGLKYLNQN